MVLKSCERLLCGRIFGSGGTSCGLPVAEAFPPYTAGYSADGPRDLLLEEERAWTEGKQVSQFLMRGRDTPTRFAPLLPMASRKDALLERACLWLLGEPEEDVGEEVSLFFGSGSGCLCNSLCRRLRGLVFAI